MSEPFLGEIRWFTFNFPPKGWAFCTGQLLPINQNQALFSLLGTVYGGDGRTTFGLPNLQGRTTVCQGNGFNLGQTGGETSHTLSIGEMPAHQHTAGATSDTGDTFVPADNLLAASPTQLYSASGTSTSLVPATVTQAGGSSPHENMAPYLVLPACIALQGIFPSQN